MVAVTRSQTRKQKALECTNSHKGLRRTLCQSCGCVQRNSDVTSSRTPQQIDIEEWHVSLINASRYSEPISLQYMPPPVKATLSLKPVDPCADHQKAMTPTNNTKLLLRQRKRRGTTERRRRRLYPSTKRLANHLISSRTMRLMRNLKLPVLQSKGTPTNLGECLQHLRWRISLKPPPPGLIFHDPTEKTPQGTPTSDLRAAAELVPRFSTTMRSMRLPPPPLQDPLKKERLRLEARFGGGSFQISTTWRPLRDIPPSALYKRRQGTLDSDLRGESVSVNATGSENESGSSDTTVVPTYPLPKASYADTLLKFTPSKWKSLSLVNDREVLVAMRPLQLSWTYQDEAGAILREKRQAGIFGFSESAGNIRASRAITRLLVLRNDDSSQWKEVGFRLMVAQLFADIWSRKGMPSYCSFQVNCFMMSGITAAWRTTLDVACLPDDTVLPSSSQVMPVFLAAQYVTDSERGAVEQLASAFHTTLMIMIVYYLDRRSRVDENLPSWMVLYGVIFDESGFRLQEFYPVYTGDRAVQPADIGWGASSGCVASSTTRIFTSRDIYRGRLIHVLLRAVSRAQEILQRLVQWDGYERLMMSLLLPIK